MSRFKRIPNCSTCKHPERAIVEDMMSRGCAHRAVAKQFGLSATAVQRHFKLHVSGERKAEKRAAYLQPGVKYDELLIQRGRTTLEEIDAARAILWRRISIAETAGDDTNLHRHLTRLQGFHETILRATGEIRSNLSVTLNSTTNIMVDAPAYQQLRNIVLKALERHPEARADVALALAAMARKEAEKLAGPPVLELEAAE